MLTLPDFIADASGQSYSAQFRLNGNSVAIHLAGADKAVFAFFDFDKLLQLLGNAPRMIAAELLTDKNGDWRKPGEAEISKEQFIRKLRLLELNVFPDQQLELFYDDGGLFWGHTVIARFAGDGNLLYATLAG